MSLDPLTSNLGQLRAKHLLRRSLFHYNNTLLGEMSNLTAADAIDQLLLDDTISYNEPYDPLPLKCNLATRSGRGRPNWNFKWPKLYDHEKFNDSDNWKKK